MICRVPTQQPNANAASSSNQGSSFNTALNNAIGQQSQNSGSNNGGSNFGGSSNFGGQNAGGTANQGGGSSLTGGSSSSFVNNVNNGGNLNPGMVGGGSSSSTFTNNINNGGNLNPGMVGGGSSSSTFTNNINNGGNLNPGMVGGGSSSSTFTNNINNGGNLNPGMVGGGSSSSSFVNNINNGGNLKPGLVGGVSTAISNFVNFINNGGNLNTGGGQSKPSSSAFVNNYGGPAGSGNSGSASSFVDAMNSGKPGSVSGGKPDGSNGGTTGGGSTGGTTGGGSTGGTTGGTAGGGTTGGTTGGGSTGGTTGGGSTGGTTGAGGVLANTPGTYDDLLQDAMVDNAMAFQDGAWSFLGSGGLSKASPESQYWENKDGSMVVKDGVDASDAIQDLWDNPQLYSMECASAVVAVAVKSRLDVIGADDFNAMYDSVGGLTISGWNGAGMKPTDFEFAQAGEVTVGGNTNLEGERAPFDPNTDTLEAGNVYYFDKPGDNTTANQGWNTIYIGQAEDGKQLFWTQFGVEKVDLVVDENGVMISGANRDSFDGHYLSAGYQAPNGALFQNYDTDQSALATA